MAAAILSLCCINLRICACLQDGNQVGELHFDIVNKMIPQKQRQHCPAGEDCTDIVAPLTPHLNLNPAGSPNMDTRSVTRTADVLPFANKVPSWQLLLYTVLLCFFSLFALYFMLLCFQLSKLQDPLLVPSIPYSRIHHAKPVRPTFSSTSPIGATVAAAPLSAPQVSCFACMLLTINILAV